MIVLRRHRTGVVLPAWNVRYVILDRTVTGLLRGVGYVAGAIRVGRDGDGWVVCTEEGRRRFAKAWDAAENFIEAAGVYVP